LLYGSNNNNAVNKTASDFNYLSTFREGGNRFRAALSRDTTPEKQQQQMSTREGNTNTVNGVRSIDNKLKELLTRKKALAYTISQAVRTKAGRMYNGKTKINQDSFLLKTKIFNIDGFNLYGVFDGHGLNGHHISATVRNYLSIYFTKAENYFKPTQPKKKHVDAGSIKEDDIYLKLKEDNYKIIKDAFQAAETELKSLYIDVNFSGTTCILVIIINDKIICANCGDSRAIMTIEGKDKRNQVVQISRDHKPDLLDEKQRILKANGWVEKYNQNGLLLGPFRVFVKNEYYPGLAMSRSIGDFIAGSVGVISEPEITEFIITDCSKFLVLGSDGVFEFLSNEKVSDIVHWHYSMNNIEGAAEKVVEEAVKSWASVNTY
jgi:serine/threonine protein phosphatase PrpC